jgi:hypothetical protein
MGILSLLLAIVTWALSALAAMGPPTTSAAPTLQPGQVIAQPMGPVTPLDPLP